MSPTIFCCRRFSGMLPREGELQQTTMVSLSSGHMMEFWEAKTVATGRTESWKGRSNKRKSSRNLHRISLKSLAKHQAAYIGSQTRTKNQDKEQLLGISKLNNCNSSHNAEDI